MHKIFGGIEPSSAAATHPKGRRDLKDLELFTRQGLERLYDFQHSDGGWGWWYDDYSDTYQTAWVLFGLSVIRDSGYTVEPRVIEDAASWLKSNKDKDPRIQAYVLYSLASAGQGDREGTLRLAQEGRDKLDPFSQAALALALHDLGEEGQARALLKLLEERIGETVMAVGDSVITLERTKNASFNV